MLACAAVWSRRTAIRPVPTWARLRARDLSEAEERLTAEADGAEAFEAEARRLEREQPPLSAWLAQLVERANDDTAQALAYLLSVEVWAAFRDAFGDALGQVSSTELRGVEELVALDEELRGADAGEPLESDDVIAVQQPDAVAFVRANLELAIETGGEVDALHRVYRAILVEILALSYAVRPPARVHDAGPSA